MALTSRITKTLPIPGEDGQTVTIRKLSHHQLMMARDARFDAIVSKMKALEGVKLPSSEGPSQTTPADEIDQLTALRFAVTDWTYGEVTPEAVADLDEDTAAWLFDEVLAFSVRSAADTKASASDSPPSTDQAVGAGLTS